MAGILDGVGDLFKYKEPVKTKKDFELLEDESEHNENIGMNTSKEQDQKSTSKLSSELSENLAVIKKRFHMSQNKDITTREFVIGREVKAFMVYVDGMMDKKILNLSIFPQLMAKDILDELEEDYDSVVDYLIKNVLTVHQVHKANTYNEIIKQVLNGKSALFIEGSSEGILIETTEFAKRGIEKPITETVVKGSQEGLTETLNTNVILIRRIIRNENLVIEMLPIGNENHLIAGVFYLDGVVNPKVVEEVKKRINSIEADYMAGSGMLEQYLEAYPIRLFPQVITTERPDRIAYAIMEGHVAIITEGTPFAIIVPITFFELLQTLEDSSLRFPLSNFIRLLRLFGLFVSTLLPALYVALILFHVEMIPTQLLLSVAKARENVPFPTFIEVLIMEVSFELIREGGVRVPSVIGQTLGVVGALILGQTAVAAGLVSPMLVIVVSITAIGNFTIPNYSLALSVRYERFLFILAGAFLGFYG
ncbi:MAG: spore germination protein, partial [Vallitaleaceae bacterium]|nr:spore germination protein [Vallitaleaceae bacterium]